MAWAGKHVSGSSNLLGACWVLMLTLHAKAPLSLAGGPGAGAQQQSPHLTVQSQWDLCCRWEFQEPTEMSGRV